MPFADRDLAPGITPDIVVDEGNTVYDSRNNCNAIIEKTTNKLVQGFATTKIPDGVKTIAAAAFRSLATLTEIEIPASRIPTFKAGKALKDAVAK